MLTQFLPPGSTPASQNPLADETVLTLAQVVFGLMQVTGASPAQLFSWAAIATTDLAGYDTLHATAQDIKNTTASHYDPVTWPTVAEPLSDQIRGSQRDALVAYVMARLGFTDTGDLFELLLIDVEMGACMGTSRIRQAINSAQLFVQRCLLNLETEVSPGQIDAGQWNTWRSQYSIWAAAREVFLFPEEYMIEQLRDDQTPIFSDFSNTLLQNDITSDSAAQAFLDYLEELKTIARLDICGMYYQEETDPNTGAGIDIIHVVGRTWHTPRTYYYRTLTNGQAWSAWEPIQADITGDHVQTGHLAGPAPPHLASLHDADLQPAGDTAGDYRSDHRPADSGDRSGSAELLADHAGLERVQPRQVEAQERDRRVPALVCAGPR